MMKKSKFIAIFLTFILFVSSLNLFAYAEESTENNEFNDTFVSDNLTIFFDQNTSEIAKERIIAHFTQKDSTVESKGLTCSLFGHNLETGVTHTVTHKVNATSPRCLRETFDYEICSRCDYSEYTLIASTYIVCCS